MDVREKIKNTISKHRLIERGDRIIVGVSGGPDSICLLHLLWSLRGEYGIELFVVHLDHQFRGKESENDAKYVKEFCDKLGIKAYSFSINVSEYSNEKKITFEEAGRELRYKLFYEIADETGSTKIAVAQNSNDQAETMLMRLMRGSGLEGLTAISYLRDEKIIRPLLDINRKEIEAYCVEFDLKPRIDKTNFQSIYTRNKIRLELIPYIEENFNSNIVETLCRSANILRDDKDYLLQATKEVFDGLVVELQSKRISLDLHKFNKLHIALKRRVLRYAIEKIIGSLKNISLIHVDNSIDIIKREKVGSKLNLPQDILIELGYNSIDIKIYKGNNKNIENFEYIIPFGKSIYIEDLNITINANEISVSDIGNYKSDNMIIYIDGDKVEGKLSIRNRKAGDRFVPLGMKGSKKIKDYFIDEKIPKDIRKKIPLVWDERNIIWVVGHRMSELYKVDSETSRVIKLKVQEGCTEK